MIITIRPNQATYLLTVNKADQPSFDFTQSSITTTYSTSATPISNATTGGAGTGEITYSIDNTNVATISTGTGLVTIQGAGTATITATKAGDDNYNDATATYILTINKAEQHALSFTQTSITITYDPSATTSNIATGGTTGSITYESDNTSVAIVNSTGQITITGAGTATITATREGNANYKPISTSYVLTVKKAQQKDFRFTTDSIAIALDGIVSNPTTGGKSTGGVTYSISNTNVATISTDTGEMTLISTGTAIITANIAGDNNYLPASATYSLKVLKPFMTLGIKNIQFDWQRFVTTTATDHYRLESALGNNGAYVDASTIGFVVVPNSTNIKQTNVRADISLHRYIPLLNGAGAQYQIQACDSGDICDSTTTYGSLTNEKLKQLIGYIKASNTGATDTFGNAVSLSADGNTLAVGADREDSNSTGVGGEPNNSSATDSGAVYVFVRDSSSAKWTQQAYIKASNTGAGDNFGTSVSLSGDGNTLAVGAVNEDSNSTGVGGADNSNAANSGAVYVFTRNTATVTWSQQAYVKASNTDADDKFGISVSLSGDGNTLAVGAYLEDSTATGVDGSQENFILFGSEINLAAGAVYVFTRSVDTWNQKAYIKASDLIAENLFGHSVSLSSDGNTLAVGAINEDSDATGVNGEYKSGARNKSGAVYVFTRNTVTAIWSQQAYIKASNTGADDQFGYSVSLSDDGNTLAVGAWLEDSNSTGVNGIQDNSDATNSGAAYVFVRDSSSNWSQQAYIKASNTGADDQFGMSVSLNGDGNTLAVGAHFDDSDSIGVDGEQGNDVSKEFDAGAVYVFTRSGDDWDQQAYIKASNTSADDRFGNAVSLSGDGNTLAVGAHFEDGNADESGAVYLY